MKKFKEWVKCNASWVGVIITILGGFYWLGVKFGNIENEIKNIREITVNNIPTPLAYSLYEKLSIHYAVLLKENDEIKKNIEDRYKSLTQRIDNIMKDNKMFYRSIHNNDSLSASVEFIDNNIIAKLK